MNRLNPPAEKKGRETARNEGELFGTTDAILDSAGSDPYFADRYYLPPGRGTAV